MTTEPKLLLGIDGGGTSTVALLAGSDHQLIGRGTSGPSNAKAVGEAAARQAIDLAIRSAFAHAERKPEQVAVACLGLAGFDRPEDKALLGEWAKAGNWAEKLVLVNDGDLVVAGANPNGWGVGVISGTGSIAVARAPDGRRSRAGGWGPVFGDAGSAYDVETRALRKIAYRADHRETVFKDPDPLTRSICKALGIKDPSELVSAIYAPGFDRAKIAALAPAVLEAADKDPALNVTLLARAGMDLAAMAIAAAGSLGWKSGDLPIGLSGGFLLASGVVQHVLIQELEKRDFQPIVQLVKEPAHGALNLALNELA